VRTTAGQAAHWKSGFEIIELMIQNPVFAKTNIILITGTHFDKNINEKHESQIHILQKMDCHTHKPWLYKSTFNCI